jgi:signal transduction histidine kinase
VRELAASSLAPHAVLEHVDGADLPIGVYVVAADGRLLAANAAARALLELPQVGPIDARITELHVDPDRHRALIEAAERAGAAGSSYERSIVHLRVGDRDVFVEDFLRPLRSEPYGTSAGYLGCMLDITEEHVASLRSQELSKKVEELTLDIGRILHANTSTLIMVNQTLLATAQALGSGLPEMGGPNDPSVDPGVLERWIERSASALAQSLERLQETGDPERRREALPPDAWKDLESHIALLRHYPQRIPIEELRNPTLRTAAVAVAARVRSIPPRLLPREPVRDVVRAADELQRAVCLADVQTTRVTVIQMDYTLRALRDFVTAEMRPRERRERLDLVVLVQEALAQLAEFARSSHVEIVWRDRSERLYAVGNERDLLRALANLLHNAIKYSWRRDRGRPPWVSIRTEERSGMASIEFETWGVPITRDEIERGLIYQMGYRGKWSTDRGRLGTGIGLTDAQRVAHEHGGRIHVESQPSATTGLSSEDESYYRQPFLTRVSLQVPVAT